MKIKPIRVASNSCNTPGCDCLTLFGIASTGQVYPGEVSGRYRADCNSCGVVLPESFASRDQVLVYAAQHHMLHQLVDFSDEWDDNA